MRILLASCDGAFLDTTEIAFKSEGFAVDSAGSAADSFEFMRAMHYDACIIDTCLSDECGTELLKRMRAARLATPALIISPDSDLKSKVENFQAGADDYVVKPAAATELAIRVAALLRRAPSLQDSVITVADLEINRHTRQARRSGKRIELSAREYSLLECLALSAGRVLSRTFLMERIWEQPFQGVTNVVDVYIGHLRRKIDVGHQNKLIHTVRGFGYSLQAEQ